MSRTSGEARGRAGCWAKLALLAAALLFSLAAAEVALRVIGYSYPEFYTTDPVVGVALRPGAEGWYRKEGEAYVRVNGRGLRDREHDTAKPADTFRIAVIGDSYAEALQVGEDETFWAVMGRRLQECGAFAAGRRVEVVNFGVSGYGTAQELLTLRERALLYSPDLVLLAFTTNNDVTDNTRALKRTDQVPYFTLRDGRLTLDDSFRSTRAYWWRSSAAGRAAGWLRDHSRVVQLVMHAHAALRTRLKAARTSVDAPAPPPQQQPPTTTATQAGASAPLPGEELGIDNLVYREPRGAEWEEAWRVTEALLVAMRDEAQAHGARFLVVTLSNGIQVYPDPAAREAFARRTGAADLFYPDLRVGAVGQREGFEVLTLAPALQAYADEHRAFLHGFGPQLGNGHWNQLGHKVAGELIAEHLCAAPR